MPDTDPSTSPASEADTGSDAVPAGPSEHAVAAVHAMGQAATVSGDGGIASGRGLTYEWEFVAAGLYDRVDHIEQSGAPGGLFFLHTQTVAAAVWTIPHGLNTIPDVLVVDTLGQQLHADVSYPDNDTAVVTHGQPYAGTAYLRG